MSIQGGEEGGGGNGGVLEDMGLLPPAAATSPSAAAGGGGGGKRAKRGEMGAPASFLDKLCDILAEPQLSEHIAWNEEGDGIVIRKVEQFASDVLPKYYKHSNYQSFVRQLNIYGFHKTKHDEHCCEFKQPHFRRGQRHLLALIRRKGQGNTVAARHREDNVVAEEAKGGVERVSAELRRLCNRVAHLEAEMGMMNHRHDTIKLESQALWRVLLGDGGERLRRNAKVALQKIPTTSSELMLFQRAEEDETEKKGAREEEAARQRPLPSPQSSLPRPYLQQQRHQQHQQQLQSHDSAAEFPQLPQPAGSASSLSGLHYQRGVTSNPAAVAAARGGGEGHSANGNMFANSIAAALTGNNKSSEIALSLFPHPVGVPPPPSPSMYRLAPSLAPSNASQVPGGGSFPSGAAMPPNLPSRSLPPAMPSEMGRVTAALAAGGSLPWGWWPEEPTSARPISDPASSPAVALSGAASADSANSASGSGVLGSSAREGVSRGVAGRVGPYPGGSVGAGSGGAVSPASAGAARTGSGTVPGTSSSIIPGAGSVAASYAASSVVSLDSGNSGISEGALRDMEASVVTRPAAAGVTPTP